MQITVTIPDDFAAQAEARGVSLEAYIQSLIEHAQSQSPPLPRARSPKQIDAFFSSMAEGSEKLPLLPTASFVRESFYADRY